MKIGIIGGGKVGCCLAEYLQNHLVGITASTSTKNQELADRFHTSYTATLEVIEQAEVIFLTLPVHLRPPQRGCIAHRDTLSAHQKCR